MKRRGCSEWSLIFAVNVYFLINVIKGTFRVTPYKMGKLSEFDAQRFYKCRLSLFLE